MKLSEMTTEMASEKICDLVLPIANIVEDEETILSIQKVAKHLEDKKLSQAQIIVEFVKKIFPILLKKHKDDTLELVAILSGKSLDEVKNQKITVTMKDVKESFDGDLLELFK